MSFRVFKPARIKVWDFRRGRQRETDDQFFLACNLPNTPWARRVALAVRRAAANVGMVDSQFIRVDDSYPGTLELLPLWDSMDWTEFTVEFEHELGQRIPENFILPDPKSVTVAELATALFGVLREENRQVETS